MIKQATLVVLLLLAQAVLLESAALLGQESPLTEHIRRQWRAAYREGY